MVLAVSCGGGPKQAPEPSSPAVTDRNASPVPTEQRLSGKIGFCDYDAALTPAGGQVWTMKVVLIPDRDVELPCRFGKIGLEGGGYSEHLAGPADEPVHHRAGERILLEREFPGMARTACEVIETRRRKKPASETTAKCDEKIDRTTFVARIEGVSGCNGPLAEIRGGGLFSTPHPEQGADGGPSLSDGGCS